MKKSNPDSPIPLHPARPAALGAGCPLCALRSRRAFTSLLLAGAAAPAGLAWAQDASDRPDLGVRRDVGNNSRFTKLVSAEQMETAGQQQYLQLKQQASRERVLAPDNDPQLVRLRAIAGRILPHAPPWNARARNWKWEVNLLQADELNAFCMPGGKIAFYRGILRQLQLSDDEVATVMGHEIAHALREHARERAGKSMATQGGIAALSILFGLGDLGRLGAGVLGNLLSLKFSRDDESEADIVGMDLAARAGHDPAAGVTLWQKMMALSQQARATEWMSTHPSSDSRIQDIRNKLPKVMPLYQRADKPRRDYGPPPR